MKAPGQKANLTCAPLRGQTEMMLYTTGGKRKACRPSPALHLVLSSPAPYFYPAAALSSLPLVKEYLHLYSPKITFGPLKATVRLVWPPVKMSLTPLHRPGGQGSRLTANNCWQMGGAAKGKGAGKTLWKGDFQKEGIQQAQGLPGSPKARGYWRYYRWMEMAETQPAWTKTAVGATEKAAYRWACQHLCWSGLEERDAGSEGILTVIILSCQIRIFF